MNYCGNQVRNIYISLNQIESMAKSNKKISKKPKDPKTVEAMGKALVEFGKKEYKEGNLDKQSAKVAIHDAADYFIDAAELYGSKNSKQKAKKNYKLAKKIYNAELSKKEETIANKNTSVKEQLKKTSQISNKTALIVSILSIITGLFSIFSGISNEIHLSPGMSQINIPTIIGYTLLAIGIALGIFWFSNQKS